jgi:hypothetical protein
MGPNAFTNDNTNELFCAFQYFDNLAVAAADDNLVGEFGKSTSVIVWFSYAFMIISFIQLKVTFS